MKLKFEIISTELKISINESNNIYENTFNKESLGKINMCFLAVDSIEQLLKHFTVIVEKEKYTLNKISENQYDLILKFNVLASEEQATFNLYKK